MSPIIKNSNYWRSMFRDTELYNLFDNWRSFSVWFGKNNAVGNFPTMKVSEIIDFRKKQIEKKQVKSKLELCLKGVIE